MFHILQIYNTVVTEGAGVQMSNIPFLAEARRRSAVPLHGEEPAEVIQASGFHVEVFQA